MEYLSSANLITLKALRTNYTEEDHDPSVRPVPVNPAYMSPTDIRSPRTVTMHVRRAGREVAADKGQGRGVGTEPVLVALPGDDGHARGVRAAGRRAARDGAVHPVSR